MNEQFLIDCTIPYLECFLKEDQTFYPFAMIMDKNRNVTSIAPNIDNEYPTSEYLINLYKQGIKREYENSNEYILAVICVDVFLNNATNKENAVEFRLISPFVDIEKRFYLKYTVNNNNIHWSKPDNPFIS